MYRRKKDHKLVVGFLFSNKGNKLKEVRLHNYDYKSRLLIDFNNKCNGSNGELKHRVVIFEFTDEGFDRRYENMEALKMYFEELYKNKNYSSKKYWWSTGGINNHLNSQKLKVSQIIKNKKREIYIDKILES